MNNIIAAILFACTFGLKVNCAQAGARSLTSSLRGKIGSFSSSSGYSAGYSSVPYVDQRVEKLKHDIEIYRQFNEEEVNTFVNLPLLKTFLLYNNRRRSENELSGNSITFSKHEITDIIAPFFVDYDLIEKVLDKSCSFHKLHHPANALKWFFAQKIEHLDFYPPHYHKFREHDHSIKSYCALYGDEVRRKELFDGRKIRFGIVEGSLNQRLFLVKGALEQRVFALCPNVQEIDGSTRALVSEIKPLNLSQLRKISLCSENMLASLKANTLNLPNLESIYIGYSGITEIEEGTFEKCPKLKSISFANNKITEFGSAQLKGVNLNQLEELDLSENPLDQSSKDYVNNIKNQIKNRNDLKAEEEKWRKAIELSEEGEIACIHYQFDKTFPYTKLFPSNLATYQFTPNQLSITEQLTDTTLDEID
ncbi:leucine-rich repeat domain-containing protein [Candidatus Cytomitobacter indipagum]|uniref:Leucine-rich repeat domain-containing protein n=1 Tax=Candidatus Cytomitobacter indipagum TaxID=2601575 RepID=A0A5C0UEL8_9PROT|nr:leucine-rich repeat domain-containing protein [Candidatus Cytomitobacter indipagum]QEK38157.1 leucine-rich repeat domain-containing protein [Candidatus Cytomitobacter indipagum]